MNAGGKSDGFVVPEKPPNKGEGAPSPAEGVEGRSPTKGNSDQQNSLRAQDRARLQTALDRVRQVAKRDKEVKFTTLWHHVYDPARLREAYYGLKPRSAPGVDGVTWEAYGADLEQRLGDLAARLKRGAYRAKPVRRVYIPKADGRQRPIGVPALEDKIVQRATTEVLNAVLDTDFLGFSYGFRPGRSQHHALDALWVGLMQRKVNWVLDADIRGFFDAIDHGWLAKFVGHRIADRRVQRHIGKWLKAGVLEDGHWRAVESGTPQGGSISPLLANLYLHHTFDLWAQQWRRRHARGEVILVRYADDIIAGFQDRTDAQRFQKALSRRLHRFGLDLHPDKTRLLRFGRFAAVNRAERGLGKPSTFDFLGFTHICSQTRTGRFMVRRKTSRQRLRATLANLRGELRRRLHWPVAEVGVWLGSVLRGYYQYYAVPYNSPALGSLRYQLVWLWYKALRRRSQRSQYTLRRVALLANRYLPHPRVLHPFPSKRLRVMT